MSNIRMCIARKTETEELRTVIYRFNTKLLASKWITQVQPDITNPDNMLIEVSEPRKGLKSKAWYVKAILSNADIPF